MRVLYLLPDLGYTAAARRVGRLAPALPPDRFTPHVAMLGRAGPLAEPLRAAGVPVHELGGRRADPRVLLRLRRLLRELRPDLVHAWRLPAARAAALYAFAGPRLIVSEADRGGRPTCGEQVAAEALAAGVSVVASRLPGLAEVVGEAGLLVPPGDRIELAKQTRTLLDDDGLRRRLGQAGRRRAAERFGVAALVQ